MDGILNINKPPGKTSFAVVAIVRRLSGERRVGHAGTLDPAATGVLPVCLGQGTRVIEFLAGANKTYRAWIEMGAATDTYDASGKITRKEDPSGISRKQLEPALASFCGLIQQTPPMYSAVKHQGQRLYELARAGIEVERKSRPVNINQIKIIDWQPPVVIVDVECGKGTYIRSLAHDLGQSLGCGAHLKNLVRLSYGPFDISQAVSIPQLEDAFQNGCWHNLVHPIDTVLSHWKAIVISEANERAIKNGAPVVLDDDETLRDTGDTEDDRAASSYYIKNYRRAYAANGRLLCILCFSPETGQWQPEKVFS